MGLRSWILGDYAKDLQRLEERVRVLEGRVNDLTKFNQDTLKELFQLQKSLEAKADKKEVDKELESLSRLVMAMYDKLKELESVPELSSLESLEPNEKELLVLDYIRRGEGSPSKLLSRLQISSRDLYDILKRLEAKGKVRKLRKGRRVYYVLVEG